MTLAVTTPKGPESEEKPHKSLDEKQQDNEDLLIKCISQDLGFSGGKPVAACVIYKCLLQWRSYEVERTSVFENIIQTISSSIEVADNSDVLGYWLCNAFTLLMLLQRTLKASGAASLTPQPQRSWLASLLGRMSQVLSTPPPTNSELGKLVEAKYPALLFKQQLAALLEKIYGFMRDNLKKEIFPLLGLCIQVPPFLVRKVFGQIFSLINVRLFNSLLLRRECCSVSNGEYIKTGLAELEHWCCYATEEYVGSAWEELKHIRQAVGFLVIHQKPQMTLNEIMNEVRPVLSIQQLYRISTMYWDDKYGTPSLPSEVISSMRKLMIEESNNNVRGSFLLDDDSSIPFSVDDISKSMEQIEIADIELPPLIRENSGFIFLHQRSEK